MFTINIEDILREEGETSMNTIAANIWRNKQNASGATISSLETVAKGNSLYISGKKSITTLETGVMPGTYVSASVINEWANKKGFWSGYNYRANTISRRILNSGSLLYRKGGRTDVYTDEYESLMRRLGERIIDRFIIKTIVENEDK